MERILYFDSFAGISGDMSIGALIDLGLEPAMVLDEINKLGISGYKIEIEKVNRFSISGTDIKVILADDGEGHHHHHASTGHNDKHHHCHDGSVSQGHDHHRGNDKERNLEDITNIINASRISQKAKELSVKIFTEIARAEAVVHNKNLDEVHFHEVGAIDSIIDIVGTAICIDMLKVDKIYCSPVHEGQGFVRCRHGRLPIPVPAVAQMLRGSYISMVVEDIQAELVTPTGFGILKSISQGCIKMPEMHVESVGYGFGKTDTGSLNALRVFLGTTEQTGKNINKDNHSRESNEDTVTLLETNIDDTTGEVLGFTMQQLLESGALDVFYTPIYMKKNRPAWMLSVICNNHDVEKLSDIIFKETSTIGIRISQTKRRILQRNIKTISTELGDIKVKFVIVDGLERVQPEYEDCAKIAREKGISLNEVYETVKRSI